jgi:hypothetical protein
MRIEADIPLPSPRSGGRKPVMPFADLAVGQSFRVVGTAQSRVSARVAYWQRRLPGREFVTRLTDDGAVRVWRVA